MNVSTDNSGENTILWHCSGGRPTYGIPELAVGSVGMNYILLTENSARCLGVTWLVIVCGAPGRLSTLIGRGNTKAVQKTISPFVAQWSLYVPPGFNIRKSYAVPTQCVCIFRVDLRTNSGYFPIQH
jgi:hypothetical protein